MFLPIQSICFRGIITIKKISVSTSNICYVFLPSHGHEGTQNQENIISSPYTISVVKKVKEGEMRRSFAKSKVAVTYDFQIDYAGNRKQLTKVSLNIWRR